MRFHVENVRSTEQLVVRMHNNIQNAMSTFEKLPANFDCKLVMINQ